MNVNLDTIGCRLNQSEIETFASQFRAAGHTLVPTAEKADLVVINTCAVTAAATADSRQKIRKAGRAGAENIVVTGCWATLDPASSLALPGVSQVVNNIDKDQLVPDVLNLPGELFDQEPLARVPIPGARLRTRAFIKVQDGCDHRCTFCVTTLARGPGRSRLEEEILGDIHAASLGGVQEVVLTGVNLGSWGGDFTPKKHLEGLVQTILTNSDIPRLRLSSLEPWAIQPNFFSLWENPRLCRHLHLPLQSGNAATLRRMARKITPESFASLVASARQVIPDIAITTDIITGFPGETEADFLDSLAFVKRLNFAGGHVFTYSVREGTAAAQMPNQIQHAQRKARNARMRDVFAQSALNYQMKFIGKKVFALWESALALGPEQWKMTGLTDNYLRVRAEAPQKFWNQITPVRVTGLTDEGLYATFEDS